MPRFLNTITGEFVWANDPASVRYAILSHTWRPQSEGGEQSYEELKRIQADVRLASQKSQGTAPDTPATDGVQPSDDSAPNSNYASIFSHPDLSPKIREFCRVAREAGYKLAWLDACCIDKASSSELSEAIRSMFEWYKHAHVCYVHLEDVPDAEDPPVYGENIWRSRWHGRGWTLQELIAPRRVVFLTTNWRFLGTKTRLAQLLQQITGIDCDILTGRATLDSISVARRMSWAAQRYTTRVEDEAYCLMGIFGVHIPVMYGEGRNAFLRLQEEIIRTIPDQSIFVWGPGRILTHSEDPARLFDFQDDFEASPISNAGLLSASPRDFIHAGAIHATASPVEFSRDLGRDDLSVPPIHYTLTSEGIRLELLCIDISGSPDLSRILTADGRGRYAPAPDPCEDCERLGKASLLALLRCKDGSGRIIALPLTIQISRSGSPNYFLITPYALCDSHRSERWRYYHTVSLTKHALKAILSKDTISQATLERKEIVLPREYIQARTSTSLGASRKEYRIVGMRGVTGPPMVLVDPSCLEDLRRLRFTTTPPDIQLSPQPDLYPSHKFSPEQEVACISLSLTTSSSRSPFEPGLRTSETNLSLPSQYIRLTCTLTRQARRLKISHLTRCRVHWNVENHVLGFADATPPGGTPGASDQIMKPAVCIGTDSSDVVTSEGRNSGCLAHLVRDFYVAADADYRDGSSPGYVRLLRVHADLTCGKQRIAEFFLSVELSDPFLYVRPGDDRPIVDLPQGESVDKGSDNLSSSSLPPPSTPPPALPDAEEGALVPPAAHPPVQDPEVCGLIESMPSTFPPIAPGAGNVVPGGRLYTGEEGTLPSEVSLAPGPQAPVEQVSPGSSKQSAEPGAPAILDDGSQQPVSVEGLRNAMNQMRSEFKAKERRLITELETMKTQMEAILAKLQDHAAQ